MEEIVLEKNDIQGLIIRGYAKLPAACFSVVRIVDNAAAKLWLRSIVDEITPGNVSAPEHAINVGLTYSGLKRFGLGEQALGSLPLELHENFGTKHRNRVLGDSDDSDPAKWEWGGLDESIEPPPPSDGKPAPSRRPPVHLILMFYAADAEQLGALYSGHRARFEAGGLEEVKKLDTITLPERKEHFGFHDGLSQPTVEGMGRKGSPENTVAAGEFVLGYRNQYGKLPDTPSVAAREDAQKILPALANATDGSRDFGRNGSYLVFRQVQQNVSEFWKFMQEMTKDSDGSENTGAMVRLASKIVGRWPSGAPMVLTPDADDPALANKNNFLYNEVDPHGDRCPIGSHVRRTNPRDSMEPGPEASLMVSNRHRILRRGRSYGKPLVPGLKPEEIVQTPDDSAERGLHFICLNTNISRQFEFIQQTWINNPKFSGLYSDADPALGACDIDDAGPQGTFTMQGAPVRKRISCVPKFTTVRGGSYFFMPGMASLRYLASLS